ncbi:MAG: ADP-ribose pyrophosphatase [Anaerolineaceae bacterium]|nr:ADP-ribose pyrophosphatase [Anaerolineaceae bacterium]
MSITRTHLIYDGKVVNLALYEISLPDGDKAIRELIEHTGAVAIVALDDEQQVLLVRQYRIGAGDSLYEIPAGLLEPDELPEDCAIRELREETGYQPGSLQPMGGYYTAPGYTTEYIYLYLAQDLTPAPLQQDHDEFVEMVRVPLTEALSMIERQEIVDGKSIIGLLKVARSLHL